MSNTKSTIAEYKRFIKTAATGFLILIFTSTSLFAQYKGAPVKKDRLIKVLRSRQLQTNDIVAVINTNGVDFRLTPEIKKLLVAAGARPEVIRAAANNQRPLGESPLVKSGKSKSNKRGKANVPNYDDLLEQAIYSYKEQRDPGGAVRYLQAAVRLKPKSAAAYQMLGFVNLYGLNDFFKAEKVMREAVANGGSAVFRVYHDDNGKFTERCSGSLYISAESVRFESDDNRHTFETSTGNVNKIKLDRENTREWKNRSIFKMFLKIGSDKARFRFAPVSGLAGESEMVSRFISIVKSDDITPSEGRSVIGNAE